MNYHHDCDCCCHCHRRDERRVITEPQAKRPRETLIDRITWLLDMHPELNRYVEAVDYRGQLVTDALRFIVADARRKNS